MTQNYFSSKHFFGQIVLHPKIYWDPKLILTFFCNHQFVLDLSTLHKSNSNYYSQPVDAAKLTDRLRLVWVLDGLVCVT